MKIELDKNDIDLLRLAIDLSLSGINNVLKTKSAPNENDTLTYISTKLIVLKHYLINKH